jgi:predicted Zn-dependent protease
LRHDFSGYKGDRAFARDDQAQKAFSKLRSAIASSIYHWRVANSKSGTEQQRMVKEADFAYRQAYAFCPFSPEAVFHYVQFLMQLQRTDDALLIAKTAAKLDPFNGQLSELVNNLSNMQNMSASNPAVKTAARLGEMEQEFKKNPTNFQNAFDLASTYAQLQQPVHAKEVLQQIMDDPHSSDKEILVVAQAFASLNDSAGLETALEKLVKVAPELPESWYNLAGLKTVLGKQAEALAALSNSIARNTKRLALDPKSHDIRAEIAKDSHFNALHGNADYERLTATK